jgi:hypothetical protein
LSALAAEAERALESSGLNLFTMHFVSYAVLCFHASNLWWVDDANSIQNINTHALFPSKVYSIWYPFPTYHCFLCSGCWTLPKKCQLRGHLLISQVNQWCYGRHCMRLSLPLWTILSGKNLGRSQRISIYN